MEVDQTAVANAMAGAVARWADPKKGEPKANAQGVRVMYGRAGGDKAGQIRLSFTTPDNIGIEFTVDPVDFARQPDSYAKKILGDVKGAINNTRRDRHVEQSPIIMPPGVTA